MKLLLQFLFHFISLLSALMKQDDIEKPQETLQLLVVLFPEADYDGHKQIVLLLRRLRPALEIRFLHAVLCDRILPRFVRMRANPD